MEEKLDTIDRLELTIERIQTESPNASNLLAAIESDKVAASRAVAQNQQLKSQLDEIQKAYIQLVRVKITYKYFVNYSFIYFQSNDKLELTDRLQSEQHLGHEIKSKFNDIENELLSVKEKLFFKDEEMIRLSHENVELNKQLLQQSQELDRLRHYEATSAQIGDSNRDILRLRKRIAELETNNKDSIVVESTTIDEQITNHENVVQMTSSCCDDGHQHATDQSAIEATENNIDTQHQININGSENGSISSTLNIAADQAMDRLQQRFTRTMTEVADLTEEKHRLEHLVLQLQGETETIGEYIALYQNQRRLLKQREIEKDIQLQQISVEREDMKENVVRLNNLVAQLLLQHGVEDAKQLMKNGATHQQQSKMLNNNEIVSSPNDHKVKESTNIHDVNNDIDGEQKSIETASEIIKLLSEIKEKNLNHPGYGVPVLDIHHCPCCSGKLETV